MLATTERPDVILDTAIQAVGERTGLDLTAHDPGFGAARLIQLDNAPAGKQYQAEIRPCAPASRKQLDDAREHA